MAVERAADLAGMFADFGEAGTLQLGAAGGEVVPVRVILERPEERLLGNRMVQPAAQARLRAASVAARPRAGDALTLSTSGAFKVAAVEADNSGAVLLLTLTR